MIDFAKWLFTFILDREWKKNIYFLIFCAVTLWITWGYVMKITNGYKMDKSISSLATQIK